MNYFEELARIDVGNHIEKKGQFNYLSWAWAVDILGKNHPLATWEVHEYDGAPYMATDCGYFVKVTVTVPVEFKDGYQFVRKTQIHPVLDNRNKPIPQPNAFDINTSIQRCLAKAIALHGLSLYIFSGEDLPDVGYTKEQKDIYDNLLNGRDSLAFWIYTNGLSDDVQKALHNSFPKGEITKNKNKAREHETKGSKLFAEYKAGIELAIKEEDYGGILELTDELTDNEKSYLFKHLTPEERETVKKLKEAQ